jgi:hypothetical protein
MEQAPRCIAAFAGQHALDGCGSFRPFRCRAGERATVTFEMGTGAIEDLVTRYKHDEVARSCFLSRGIENCANIGAEKCAAR